MFDSVLTQEKGSRSNLAGLGLSTGVCGLLAIAALFIPSAKILEAVAPVDITFVSSSPPPPPPPPPAGGADSTPKTTTPRKPKTVVVRKTPDPEPTPTPQPEPEPQPVSASAGEAGGVAGGVQGGVAGGVLGGVVGGVVGGTGSGAIPFGQGMTRPEQIAGSQPQYSREAIAARVEGKVLVRCVITTTGDVTDCKTVKGVPMLDEITHAALKSSRFTPVTFQGRPVSVQYLFTFNFKLP